MPDKKVTDFATRLGFYLRNRLESVIFYPHPFTAGGVVVVFKDGAGDLHKLLPEVAMSGPPPGLSLHCLRREELFELALPVEFRLVPPHAVNEYSHLAYWLRHKGVVLHGRDVRAEVGLPAEPRLLLTTHIDSCMNSLRSHLILSYLLDGRYEALVTELDAQMRYLMAAALLARGVWDVTFESVPGLFRETYDDAEMAATWDEFERLLAPGGGGAGAGREAACEAAWLFESLLRRLSLEAR